MIVVSWNAEGLRSKITELQRWLPTVRADVLAVQEGQFPKAVPRLSGFQPPVVVRRARGRRADMEVVKGGDVAIYVRAGLAFTPVIDNLLAATDDSTELCGVRILGPTPTRILNIYRPPIRATNDDREDNFDPDLLPSDDETLIVGDLNAHHPSWDSGCEAADRVGTRIADWLERIDWAPLNSGDPTFASYRSGGQSAPDLAVCGSALARRSRWWIGPDLGSDHLPMVVEMRGIREQPRRIRKARMAYDKADWVAFRDTCEAALLEAGTPGESAQLQSDRFSTALRQAGVRHIPCGARADPKPWALDPELREAVAERREARRLLQPGNERSRTRWTEAKQRAAEVERRVSRDRFRQFVSETLNRPASLGRVSKLLKKWDKSTDEEQRDGQAMEDGGRLLVTDRAKADAFARTETADTPYHVLVECPALMGARLRLTGTIRPNREEVRSDGVVAALAAAFRTLQSRQATVD
ncbi:putative RNA-directed DNA polymerase from transposon BS [Amphibalanus amphitrite]|uniref:Putative RNA-directed DNA polymerase from transposon BS n=1 Tax=Amphibalanus amphitrite TaxID=1232801 RepID=A0A6A4WDJ8_AMPAM|nr:putative RNA-directed DNA polymerase from transposon BS [Amphibalanus amphitrite]